MPTEGSLSHLFTKTSWKIAETGGPLQECLDLGTQNLSKAFHQKGKRPVGRSKQRHVEKALRLERPEDQAVLVAAQMCRADTLYWLCWKHRHSPTGRHRCGI